MRTFWRSKIGTPNTARGWVGGGMRSAQKLCKGKRVRKVIKNKRCFDKGLLGETQKIKLVGRGKDKGFRGLDVRT